MDQTTVILVGLVTRRIRSVHFDVLYNIGQYICLCPTETPILLYPPDFFDGLDIVYSPLADLSLLGEFVEDVARISVVFPLFCGSCFDQNISRSVYQFFSHHGSHLGIKLNFVRCLVLFPVCLWR